MLRHALRFSGLMVLGLVCTCQGWAQYGGGGGGTSTGSTSGTSTHSYGANGALIGGVAAAAVGGAILYWKLHKSTIVGCVQSGEQGPTLQDEKDKHTYALEATGDLVKPGERVQLQGKKSKDKSGNSLFQVGKVGRDYGSCGNNAATKASPAGSRP